MRRGPERGAVIRGTTLGGLAAGRRLASRGVPAVVVGPADFQGVLHTSVVDGFVLDAALAPVSATALCEVLDPRPLVPLLRPLAAGLVGPDGQVHDLADALPSDLSPDAPWAALAERTSVRGRLLASVSHDSTGSASLRAACLAAEEWTLDPDLVAGGLARLGEALASGLLIVPADHPAARGGDGWSILDADGAPDLRALSTCPLLHDKEAPRIRPAFVRAVEEAFSEVVRVQGVVELLRLLQEENREISRFFR